MVNGKTVSKIAKYIALTAVVFAAVLAVITFFNIQIQVASAGGSAPADFTAIYIITTILPYLFIAAAAFIVGALANSTDEETVEEEEQEELPPEAQPTESTA